MVFEPSEEEPDEYDPEADQADPDAPGVTIPSVEPPEEYDPEAEFRDPDSDSLTIPSVDTDESDVPPELFRQFWAIVLVCNAALLFLSVGLMILYFWADLRRGGLLVVGGVVLLGLAYRRYRSLDLDSIVNDSTDPDSGATVDTDPAGGAGHDGDGSEPEEAGV